MVRKTLREQLEPKKTQAQKEKEDRAKSKEGRRGVRPTGLTKGVITPEQAKGMPVGGTPEGTRDTLQGRAAAAQAGRTQILGAGGRDITDLVNPQVQETVPLSPEAIASEQANIGQSQFQEQFQADGGFTELETRSERGIEKVSELALEIPTGIGNIITAGLEKITGKKFGRSDAAELAETDFGKALGVGIAGTAAALLTVTAGATIATAIKGISTKLAVSLGVSGTGILAFGAIASDVSPEILIDKFLDRGELSSIESSLGKYGEVAPTIVGTYRAGGYGNNPNIALAHLGSMQDDILALESQAQQAVILKPSLKVSKEYDSFIVELGKLQKEYTEAQADILEATPGFDPVMIQEYLKILNDLDTTERQDLISKGAIRETL